MRRVLSHYRVLTHAYYFLQFWNFHHFDIIEALIDGIELPHDLGMVVVDFHFKCIDSFAERPVSTHDHSHQSLFHQMYMLENHEKRDAR